MTNYRNLFDLTGKNVLVTGSAKGGLGFHSCLALADLGANLMVSDLADRSADLAQTIASLKARDNTGRVLSAACDISKEADVACLFERVTSELGGLDVVVHHAGVMLRGSALDTTVEAWQRVIDINLTGTWLVNRAAASVLNSGGSIINTSTLYAQMVGPIPESAYYASKAGVANLTRGLAMEWGRQGIRVNCLAPGVFYPTEMTTPLAATPERLEQMSARTMLGRLGDPEHDLVGAVAFLASDASRYVTGHLLYVDGGWSAW